MIRIADRSYADLESALESIPADHADTIVIDLGGNTIHGQYTIDKSDVMVINGTIEGDLGAYEILEDGFKRGTFRTYTLYIAADDVQLKNVSVINSNGYKQGQAVALMVDGNDFKAQDCRISSYQDTLFIAPLPEKEYEKGGFRGPLEDKERLYRRTRFINCLIEGSIDFIFGGGLAYFRNCEIRSRNIHQEVNGYVCAPNTPENEKYGFIFDGCHFTNEGDMQSSVYLARPWRDHGKCLIVNSSFDEHIRAEGYHDWDKPSARISSEFKEYNNVSSAKENRVDWLKETTDSDLKFIESLIKEEK